MVTSNGNCYFQSSDTDKSIQLLCNKSEKSTTLLRKDNHASNYDYISENEIQKGVKMQLAEDGSRWEGDWYTEKPFGFGSYYDGDGNRIFTGFMYEGRKIGCGTEFFADTHRIDYCGNFMNDKRHGWGSTYDRNGNKLFEGEWRFGNNNFDDVVFVNNEEDCLKAHDLIKELVIGEGCLNEWRFDLVIENYSNLEKIVVRKNSLQNLNSLKICNNEKLKIIEIEGGALMNGAFMNVKNVIIESISK